MSTQAVSYLHHDEKGEVVYDKLYNDEERAKILEHSKVTTAVVNQARSKANTRIAQQILMEIKTRNTSLTIKQILHRIFDGVRLGEWYPPGHRLPVVVEEVYLRQDDESEKIEDCVQRAYEKYFRRI